MSHQKNLSNKTLCPVCMSKCGGTGVFFTGVFGAGDCRKRLSVQRMAAKRPGQADLAEAAERLEKRQQVIWNARLELEGLEIDETANAIWAGGTQQDRNRLLMAFGDKIPPGVFD